MPEKPSRQQSVIDFMSSIKGMNKLITTIANEAFMIAAKTTYNVLQTATPYKSGALMKSWSVFLYGKLLYGPGVPPGGGINKPLAKKTDLIFSASVPKEAGVNANIYYVRGGSRWFDYAEHVFDVDPRNQTRFFGVSMAAYIDMIFNASLFTAFTLANQRLR